MLTRRAAIAGASAAALAPIIASNAQDTAGETDQEFDPSSPLPHKAAFSPFQGSYLNCASQHPLSLGGRDAEDRLSVHYAAQFKNCAGLISALRKHREHTQQTRCSERNRIGRATSHQDFTVCFQ